MSPLEVVRPGTPVLVDGTVPAVVVEVCLGTSLKPEYLLQWWDGRSLCGARFRRDRFEVDETPSLSLGFGRGA